VVIAFLFFLTGPRKLFFLLLLGPVLNQFTKPTRAKNLVTWTRCWALPKLSLPFLLFILTLGWAPPWVIVLFLKYFPLLLLTVDLQKPFQLSLVFLNLPLVLVLLSALYSGLLDFLEWWTLFYRLSSFFKFCCFIFLYPLEGLSCLAFGAGLL